LNDKANEFEKIVIFVN